jgi:hypothetical protein
VRYIENKLKFKLKKKEVKDKFRSELGLLVDVVLQDM